MKQRLAYLLLVLFSCLTINVEAATKRDGSLYAVYLTWKENPATTMVVQWITGNGDRHDEVDYHKLGDTDWIRLDGRHKSMPEDHPYIIHRNELTGLQPDTVYEFRVGERSEVRKFRTMPTHIKAPIRFVAGGDFYHDGLDLLRDTNRAAAATNPSFALIGGDIAYAANSAPSFLPNFILELFDKVKGQNASRWLEWLIAYSQDMVTKDGILIPMIPTIGNHDVNGRFGQKPEEAPFFYSLFAFPGRHGYGVLDFGHYLSIFALDSGHTHPVGGHQTEWLEETLEDRQNHLWKFAFYHVPAFPSYRDPNSEYPSKVRKHWVPLFEEYELTAAFENHDHTYKRTHRIRDGVVDSRGVLYLGDGAWGIEKPRTPKSGESRWYIAQAVGLRHFILVTLSKDHVDFEAIAPETGATIDKTTILR